MTDGILDSQDPEDGLTLHPSMPSVIPCLPSCPEGPTHSKPARNRMSHGCSGKGSSRRERWSGRQQLKINIQLCKHKRTGVNQSVPKADKCQPPTLRNFCLLVDKEDFPKQNHFLLPLSPPGHILAYRASSLPLFLCLTLYCWAWGFQRETLKVGGKADIGSCDFGICFPFLPSPLCSHSLCIFPIADLSFFCPTLQQLLD